MVSIKITGEGKPWYKSKTMWAGAFQVVGGVALLTAEELSTGGALTATGFISIVLRVLTKEEIRFKSDK